MNKENNYAFIDGQNLHLGTRECGWSVDHAKFRKYLAEKYHVTEAYYFLGFISEDQQELYDALQKAGFILFFREHSSAMKGKKKGNVDSDIVFSVMRKVADREQFDKVVIVSGDGDYIKLVDYLIKKNKFKKMLFPNEKFASSLYSKYGSEFYDYLEKEDVKSKIAYEK
ncbi:NYN domain-containing protein [Parasediminibacterium sp. JCM 36343]|uniref:NYN domain-containing protein n=1 Tax=Parasediminibacterium sp. JCM 36343 TaxID=3374279 RepID=UPI00397D1387